MRIYKALPLLLAAGIQMQAADPYMSEAKAAYETIKINIMKSAEKMPEDSYGFQPTKEERTFGALIGHIADAQVRICSATAGPMKAANSGKLTGKPELIAALKASFDECDAAFSAMTAENAASIVKIGKAERSKLSTLVYNTTHDNESYGTLAVYMRLKGVVPPSSEK